MTGETFHRAVNLHDDIGAPQRLSHYHPTRRSLPVARAILEGDPSIVIAAYGSGKSLAAGIGALVVKNDHPSKQALRPVIDKIASVDRDLHRLFSERIQSRGKGRVIVLTGYVPDLVQEIIRQSDAPPQIKSLDRALEWIAGDPRQKLCFDRVAIIWDEFGRHLEGLVGDGRARDLDLVQRLAEWSARAERPASSLTLLLHQNLSAYAGTLNQTSRNEWRKIEGRFRQVRFIEDSRELYQLAAEGIARRRPLNPDAAAKTRLRAVAASAVEAGWFDGLRDGQKVSRLLVSAWPIAAGALHALPRLVARVGQNERSLFSFLEEVDLSKPVGFEQLYRSFSEAMRTDVGPGGTHRRWVETESARSRADNDVERETLAAACLLQLGVDGERRRLPLETLKTAVASGGTPASQVSAAIRNLIERKLLIHRRINDDVSVWHGVDVDVAKRLVDERARRADGLDLVGFLEKHHPPLIIRATRHNLKYGTARYLSGRFVTVADLNQNGFLQEVQPRSGEWGTVAFVLVETAADLALARKRIQLLSKEAGHTVFVLPRQPLSVEDAALEIACLESLRKDDALLAEDPLVAQEIDELLTVARQHLSTILHRLTSDRPDGADWIYDSETLRVTPEYPASIVASDLMQAWYPDTPRIVNDQLMRQRISRQMQTARVRLLTRLMESAYRPSLGYADRDTSVESSIYRTVLEKTGLHRQRDGFWGFAEPQELADAGLRRAWETVKEFFTAPTKDPRPLSELTRLLALPPIGLPLGVLPIIVIAGYRAFARVVSLRTDGAYVRDILGFDSDRMFQDPERHSVEVHACDPATVGYLTELAYVFSHERRDEKDEVLRFAYDAFVQWRSSLPDGARRSTRLSKAAQQLLREINQADDPAKLFLSALPRVFAASDGAWDPVIAGVERIRNEIDSVIEGYLEEAVAALGEAFRMDKGADAVAALQSWVSCLDVDAILGRGDLRMTDKAVLRTALDTVNGRYTPQSLARALSAILLQRGVDQWVDATAGQYAMQVRECRARIEDAALACDRPDSRLAPIIRSRIGMLEQMLARIEGSPGIRRAATGGK